MHNTPKIVNSTLTLRETIALIEGAYAPATIRAYKSNFEKFITFCESITTTALPSDATTVAKYIQKLSDCNLKSASIRLAVAAISTIHKLNQLPDPTQLPAAKIELRRMHRRLGRECKQAFGITAPALERIIAEIQNDLRGFRDRAILLIAYDSLLRRSELVSLKMDDIECDTDGLPIYIRLRKSKTDQEAIGRVIRLTMKSQVAIKSWIEKAKIADGLLFRGVKNDGDITQGISPGQINRIYKRLALRANICNKEISGHSIRVGAAQDLVNMGASLPVLMNSGGWSKPETAMRYAEAMHSNSMELLKIRK